MTRPCEGKSFIIIIVTCCCVYILIIIVAVAIVRGSYRYRRTRYCERVRVIAYIIHN